jgi:hypothetical protein
MSDITIEQPDIIGLSVTSPNVLQLTVTEPAPVILSIGSGSTFNVSANLALDDLTDVTITSPAWRDNLVYDGSGWINRKDEYVVTAYSDVALTNGTANQSVFASANDSISLPALSSWLIQGSYVIASGTTSHTTAINFLETGLGGNGTCHFRALSAPVVSYGAATRSQDATAFNTSVGGAVNSTSGSALTTIQFEGVYTCLDSVTFTPQVKFSAAPGGTNLTKAGSYLKLTRLFTADFNASDPEWI